MEQSYENGGADFDGIAALSPSASNMSDISGSASNATTTVESQSNKKSKISEKVKEHFEQLPSGKRQCKHCKAKYVIREERNRLVSKTVQAVMCLKSWYAVLKREVIPLD